MTHLLHRQVAGSLPVVVGGQGIGLVDSAGARCVDASGGAVISCLSHRHPDVIAIVQSDAIDEIVKRRGAAADAAIGATVASV